MSVALGSILAAPGGRVGALGGLLKTDPAQIKMYAWHTCVIVIIIGLLLDIWWVHVW